MHDVIEVAPNNPQPKATSDVPTIVFQTRLY